MSTNNKSCQKHHGKDNAADRKYLDPVLQKIAENQSGVGRHKCPYCAYETGYAHGMNKSQHSENALTTGSTTTKAPTCEVIFAVRWLAKDDNGQAHPAGSGVVYSPNNENCLVTANHVAESCNYDPLIRQDRSWKPAEWKLVGRDIEKDIAVLHCLSKQLLPNKLNPIYGMESTFWGALGRAVGFPQIINADNSIFPEVEGLPLAIPVPVATNFSSAGSVGVGMDEMHYVGGYVNAGFSGGAIIYPATTRWTIAGIITKKPSIPRPIYQQAQGTDRPSIDRNQVFFEHSGLTKFTDIEVAKKIISRSNL